MASIGEVVPVGAFLSGQLMAADGPGCFFEVQLVEIKGGHAYQCTLYTQFVEHKPTTLADWRGIEQIDAQQDVVARDVVKDQSAVMDWLNLVHDY